MPTLRHLQIFKEVALCQKMGDAAQKLYLSQSTVSQAITEMEKYYGTLLFERINKRLFITDAGRQLLSEADVVLSDFQHLEEHMRELTNSHSLRIGVSGAVASRFLSELLDPMEAAFPGIDLQIHSYSPDYITRCLQNNIFDVALLPAAADNAFVSVPAFTDQLCFVCGVGHAFYNRDIVSVQELNGQTFLMNGSSDSGRKMLESFLREKNVNYRKNWSSSNVDSLKIFLQTGRGIALLSESYIEAERQSGQLHVFRVEGRSFQREFCAVYVNDKFMSKPLRLFLSLCQENQVNAN